MSTDTLTIRADLTMDVVLRYLRRHTRLPENTDSLIVVNRDDKYIAAVRHPSLGSKYLRTRDDEDRA